MWTLCVSVEEMQIGAATVKNIVEVPQKCKNRITISSSNSSTWYLPKENEKTYSTRYMHPTFFVALFTIVA